MNADDRDDDRLDVEAMGVRLLTANEAAYGWRIAEARIVGKIPDGDRVVFVIAAVVDGERQTRARVVTVRVARGEAPKISRFAASATAPLAAALGNALKVFQKHGVRT